MRVSNILSSNSAKLNELEDATLRSYVKKAVPSADELAVQGDSEKADRRNQGITRAARKIGQKLVKQHTQGMHEGEHKIVDREAVAALMAKKKELQNLLLSNKKIDSAVRTRVAQGLADLNARLEKLGIQINEDSDYEEIKDTVTRSISHRIMHQHLDLIRDYGLDEVTDAIEDQANFIASSGPLEEVGSSDISAWVNNIRNSLERYSKKKDVTEGNDDTVSFAVDNEAAYNAILKRYGKVIDWKPMGGDAHAMTIPHKYWGSVQELAHEAGGEAIEQNITEANLSRKEKDIAVRRLFQHDPETAEKILAMGKKERGEEKAFAAGKREIDRMKKKEQGVAEGSEEYCDACDSVITKKPHICPGSQGVAEGSLTKSIRRGILSWEDSHHLKELINYIRNADDKTLVILARELNEKPPSHSPRDLQIKLINQELKRRYGIRPGKNVDEGEKNLAGTLKKNKDEKPSKNIKENTKSKDYLDSPNMQVLHKVFGIEKDPVKKMTRAEITKMRKDAGFGNSNKRIKKTNGKKGVAEEYDPSKQYGVRYKLFAGREGRLTTKEAWYRTAADLERAVERIKNLGNFYEIDAYSYPQKTAEQQNQQDLNEMDTTPNEQLDEYLNEAEEHIRQAINFLRMASVKGRNAPGPFSGQLKSYIIPHLESWIEDERQPGSIASLKRILFNEY